MRVCEHNHVRGQALQFSQSIQTSIDHHVCAAIRNQQRRMHATSSRAHVNLTTRADERQLHLDRLVSLVGRAVLCTPLVTHTARTGVRALPGTARTRRGEQAACRALPGRRPAGPYLQQSIF